MCRVARAAWRAAIGVQLTVMPIPTEPIGSIPRPLGAHRGHGQEGEPTTPAWTLCTRWPSGTPCERFEATGSPGRSRTASSASTTISGRISVDGLPNTHPEGFQDPLRSRDTSAACPGSRSGPFRYRRYADSFLEVAQRHAPGAGEAGGHLAVRALSLMYPAYAHPGLLAASEFIEDLLREHETRGAPLPSAAGRTFGPGRLHGGQAVDEDRPFRRPPPQLHRPEQSRAGALLRR